MSEKKQIIELKENEIIDIYSRGCTEQECEYEVEVNCDEVGNKVNEGSLVYYGDGTVVFGVESVVNKDHIKVRAVNSGEIEHSKSFIMSETLNYNRDNLKVALDVHKEAACAGIAFYFVETGEQLEEIRKLIVGKNIKIISKIETKSGIDNLEEILEYTDEIMLGRGDMGLFSDIASFGIAQERVIKSCKKAGKKIWIATDILNSMQKKVIPSRSEMIDVYNLKKMQVDGVVLTYGLVRSSGIKNAIKFINEQKC